MWEKPSYEIIDVCAEVTAYVYKDSSGERAESATVDKESQAAVHEGMEYGDVRS